MKHPDAWAGILLALGAFRVTRLVGWDDLTIPLRRWACGMGDDEHHEFAHKVEQRLQEGKTDWPLSAPVTPQRFYFSKMIHCPWCAGFWVSVAVWLVWLWVPSVAVGLSVPLSFSAAVGLIAKNLDP